MDKVDNAFLPTHRTKLNDENTHKLESVDFKKRVKNIRSLLNRITGDNFEKISLRILVENTWNLELLKEFVKLLFTRSISQHN